MLNWQAMSALTFPILHLLADGQFHSGEALAQRFKVTRATIWNALATRRKFGCGNLFCARARL